MNVIVNLWYLPSYFFTINIILFTFSFNLATILNGIYISDKLLVNIMIRSTFAVILKLSNTMCLFGISFKNLNL